MAKGKQGLASVSPEKRREIASLGGKASAASGRAHRWTSETARAAGRKGGHAVKKRPRLTFEAQAPEAHDGE